MKKALLAVSVGTSHRDALERGIAAVEAELAAAFPDREVRRAFTSDRIIHRLLTREGLQVDTVDRALRRLAREGFDDVVIQPTHVISGGEYDKMMALASPAADGFARVSCGAPLLTGAEDCRAAAAALAAGLPEREEGRAVVYMGHGAGRCGSAAYALLEDAFQGVGRSDVVVGAMAGAPGLEEVLRRLEEMGGIQRIFLAPLMVAAGGHVKNDMAGEKPDSWRSRLTERGYAVRCGFQGLGENPGIRRLFAAHARAAEAGR